MKEYTYIIIGGGMTGSAAVMGIRELDDEGTIAMFTKENFGPYNRPPLSKSLWSGKEVDEIMRPLEKFDVDLYLETEIDEIVPSEKIIFTGNGEKFQYQKLLLANGGDPIQIPDTPEGVIFYRTRSDYHHLKTLSENKGSFCVIGGGFIGSEIAAALNKQGNQVTMIFPEVGISGLVFPEALSEFLNGYYQEKGVKVITGHLVQNIEEADDGFTVAYKSLENNDVIEQTFDGVVIGIGIKPNTALALEAGIHVDDGIIVNENLQTNFPDIFAAGDVAQFFNPHLEKRTRVEHEDNANNMGMRAGKNMTGQMEAYTHFPFFYSDLFDLGYEAVGELNKDYEIYTDWIDKFKKGTIFYLDQGKIRGLIFWNLWGKVDEGRKTISEGKTFNPDDLKGMFS
jgi:NADPH-dependent 2,4-dienoyl-CoA reductase/sulfur reductase-like enzyme